MHSKHVAIPRRAFHYLAGVSVQDAGELFSVAAEGGGTRIFDRAVHHCLLRLR
jgi:hypothetical protein